MPSTEQRDLRTLLRDRHQWVRMRARLQHTLQAMALNTALRRGPALWSVAGQNALQALPLPPYSSQRRTELLRLYVQLQKRIQGVFDYAGLSRGSRYRPYSCCLPRIFMTSAPGLYVFAAQLPTLPIPCLRFAVYL